MEGDWIAMQANLWDARRSQSFRLLTSAPASIRRKGGPRQSASSSALSSACGLCSILTQTMVRSDGYDAETIDTTVGIKGFAFNLQHVGW